MSDHDDTYTHRTLCSQFNEELGLVCDEPAGHEGAHRASVFWGGYEGTEDEFDIGGEG